MIVGLKLYREPAVVEPPAAAAAVPDAAKPGSASIVVPVPSGAEPPEVPAFSVPDTYKDRTWLKDVDSLDKLLAKADGAMKLVGTRPAGIPAADAPPEEWNKFYEAMGRPKTAAEYQITADDKTDPAFKELTLNAFHEAGLSPAQAKLLWDKVGGGAATLTAAQTAALDTQFTKLATDTFGVNRDATLASSKALIEKFAPPSMKPMIAKMDNNNLILMAGVVDGMKKAYITEDAAPQGAPAAAGMTPADISLKARELMSKPEYGNASLPGHERVVKEVNELYSALRGPAKK